MGQGNSSAGSAARRTVLGAPLKKVLTSWVYGMIAAALMLWLLASILHSYVVFPLPTQAVDMGRAYAPQIARYDLLLILAVMIGGAVFALPILFVLQRWAKKA